MKRGHSILLAGLVAMQPVSVVCAGENKQGHEKSSLSVVQKKIKHNKQKIDSLGFRYAACCSLGFVGWVLLLGLSFQSLEVSSKGDLIEHKRGYQMLENNWVLDCVYPRDNGGTCEWLEYNDNGTLIGNWPYRNWTKGEVAKVWAGEGEQEYTHINFPQAVLAAIGVGISLVYFIGTLLKERSLKKKYKRSYS